MMMRGLLKVVLKNLWEHAVFKFIHCFSMLDLDKNVKREDFEFRE